MAIVWQFAERKLWVVVSAIIVLFAGYAASVLSDEVTVTLSGNQEIPPVTTSALGTGTFTVGADKSVSGSVTVSGMSATVAHIHEAAAGTTGSIVIPLTKISDNVWAVPAGAKLTDAQYESYKAGNLYYNVHSAAYKSGEIRGQIKP
ncbi:MAG: CHRD domain-containing protein [Betaproteobacteria bacterium]|nr:MAG: CHRD domain-containing protein [Betaproteobacteria bacterium]